MGYGQLKDKEGEIRQESILLLLSRYLAGNADLILATKKANLAAIKNQLQRSIFAAVQDQLGLKLESKKGPVEIVVVDHVDKPSDN